MATQPLGYYSGLASGLDFYSLVDQMMTIERRPAARLESNISLANQRQKELGTYRTLLKSIQGIAADFADRTGLQAYAVSLSGNKTAGGEAILAASASAGAVPGSHKVEVETLAAAQRNIGTGQATSGDDLGLTGTIEINGQQIDIAATDSLSEIRDNINARNSGATPTGVVASILKAGDGDHRLVLTAEESGTTNAFTVADVSGTVAATLGLANVSTAAKDSKIWVDGVEVIRSSNVVEDALEGVKLTLKAEQLGTKVDLQIQRHYAAAQDSAQAFVDAYNAMVAFVQKQNVANSGGANPPLFGDSSLRTNRSALANIVVSKVAGLPSDLNTLGLAGIEVKRDGTLELDTTRFKAAHSERFQDLESLLADRGAALKAYLDDQLLAGSGALAVKEQAITDSVASMESRILDIDSRLERKRDSLIRRFTAFEVEISRLQELQKSMKAQFAQLVPDKK